MAGSPPQTSWRPSARHHGVKSAPGDSDAQRGLKPTVVTSVKRKISDHLKNLCPYPLCVETLMENAQTK